MRIKSSKWLLCYSYNPNKLEIISHVQKLSTEFDKCFNKYEDISLISDFT